MVIVPITSDEGKGWKVSASEGEYTGKKWLASCKQYHQGVGYAQFKQKWIVWGCNKRAGFENPDFICDTEEEAKEKMLALAVANRMAGYIGVRS